MSATILCEFFIPGIPVPQGSKSSRVIPAKGTKRAFAVLYDDNPNLGAWRDVVTAATVLAYSGPKLDKKAAVDVELEFRFERPKTSRREYPTVKPDLDKCERAVFDSITKAGNIWVDDSQVVDSHCTKVYAADPGVLIRVFDKSEQPSLEGLDL